MDLKLDFQVTFTEDLVLIFIKNPLLIIIKDLMLTIVRDLMLIITKDILIDSIDDSNWSIFKIIQTLAHSEQSFGTVIASSSEN